MHAIKQLWFHPQTYHLDPQTTTREAFIDEIKRAAGEILVDEIKKAVNSFTRRLRNIEDLSGKKVNK